MVKTIDEPEPVAGHAFPGWPEKSIQMNAAVIFTTLDIQVRPDPLRTVIRPFSFSYPSAFANDHPPRRRMVVDQVRAPDARMRARMRKRVLVPVLARHRKAEQAFLRRFDEVCADIGGGEFAEDRKMLIGANSARSVMNIGMPLTD